MHIANEPFKPRPELVRLVESCLERISPDGTELNEWFRSYAMGHKTRIAFDIDIVRENLPQNTRVLEFGSVPLLFTAALSEYGYQVVGVDIAPERFQSSIEKLGLTVLRCDIELEKLPIQDNTYDAIVFNELFEHLRINPIFTMSEVFRVVKPNGLLFLSSPNLRSLEGLVNFLFRNRAYSCCGDLYAEYEKLEKLGHMGHVREYTTAEITTFLKRSGFVVEKLIFRGGYRSRKAQVATLVFAALRPFVSYVARKPAQL